MNNPIIAIDSDGRLATFVDLHFDGKGIVSDFTVPATYRWNGASIPEIKVFEEIIGNRFDTEFRIPSLAHDYLYEHPEICSRKAADKYFRLLLKEEGIGPLKRNAMYLAVRLFGGIHYDNNTNNHKEVL